MKHGNSYQGVKCPYCNIPNSKVLEGRITPREGVLEFTKPCEHCNKPLYFWVSYGICIDAEKYSKVV